VDLRNFLHLVRGHWKLIVAVTLLAAGASALLTARMTPAYSSSVTFYVSAQAKTANDPTSAYDASLLSQQQVQSYADLLTGPLLAGKVVSRLHLPESPAELSGSISAHPIAQTVLLTATVTSTSPARAQLIARAAGTAFVQLASALGTPPGGGKPLVRVTVVGPASFSATPVSPSWPKNIAIAAGLGLLIGIALAAARRSLDTTIKSASQLAAAAGGTPVFGSVPFDHRAHRQPLIDRGDPSGRRVEAYRKISTNLQFVDVDLPRKVLLVTSAGPEEGKSSTVCNLAIALAGTGKRIAVVEADLRRPRAASYLGLPNGAGVTSVLAGSLTLSEALQSWGDDQFAVLTSGPPAPNPSDLLGSRRMRDLLGQLRDVYDVVLVDAPPVLPFADAAATAPACDGVILVVRYGKARADRVLRAVDALQAVGTTVLGTVLSMEPGGWRGTDYGYGYRRYRAAGAVAGSAGGDSARAEEPTLF